MLDNVGLRYPHRASGAKAPRTLRPLPLLRFAVSATGGAHLCSIQYYLRFWLGICRTSLAVSALRIMRYCPEINLFDIPVKKPIKSSYVREKAGQGTDISVCALSGCCFHEQLALRANFRNYSMGVSKCQWIFVQQKISKEVVRTPQLELFKFVLGIVRDRYNIVLELFQVTSHFFAFQASLSFSFYRAAAVICRYRSQQHRQSAFPA
jgi:hypothetical protein